jgi:hypothetical protein
LTQVQAWAQKQQRANPNLHMVDMFGSYGRRTACVGAELENF